MNILITGGAGFVGSNLAAKLIAQKHKVIAVDNFITSARENIEGLLANPNFEFHELDVTNLEFKNKFINWESKIDQVYNLACPTGVSNLTRLAEEMIDTCSVGAKQILEVAKKHQAKVVITSTAEIYGDPQRFPQTEDYTGNVDPVGKRSAYEEGKRFKEALAAMFVRKYKLDVKIVRLFNAYGPGMSVNDPRVHPHMIRQVLNGLPPIVYGDGLQTRTFCYIDDTINAMQLVMKNGEAGQVYNIGSDQPISMKELAEKIIQLTGAKLRIGYQQHFINDHHNRLPGLDKIKALGWERKINLEEGTKRTIE